MRQQKRSWLRLIARTKTERKALDGLNSRIADLEARTRQALAHHKLSLAEEGAKLLADLENEQGGTPKSNRGCRRKGRPVAPCH